MSARWEEPWATYVCLLRLSEDTPVNNKKKKKTLLKIDALPAVIAITVFAHCCKLLCRLNLYIIIAINIAIDHVPRTLHVCFLFYLCGKESFNSQETFRELH